MVQKSNAHTLPPLILTLTLDESSQAYFNELRKQYFPPERNHLEAHLTLFHHLPGEEMPALTAHLEKVAADNHRLVLEVTEVKMIGRGVAFRLENEMLIKLHGQLFKEWKDWLTPQDRQKLWPHITVQNKVTKAKAQGIHRKLVNDFTPFTVYGTGLQLWEYRGGPWKAQQIFSFAQK